MIKVNGKKVVVSRFPDGTADVKGDDTLYNDNITIAWNYEDDSEYMVVSFLTKYYQEHDNKVFLFLPYVPNARMDRIEESNDIFTMKYFAEMINYLQFEKVFIFDPHSSVATATIKNSYTISNNHFISDVLNLLSRNYIKPIVFFPDEGAMKRYSKRIKVPYAFGIKKRDWKTGQILGLEISGIERLKIDGKSILICDDICSKGGTFYYAAKKIREMGAKNIYLCVSHCEKSIYDGHLGDDKTNLLDSNYIYKGMFDEGMRRKLIDHVFTTDSIYPFQSDKNVTVFPVNVRYPKRIDTNTDRVKNVFEYEKSKNEE